MTVVRYLSLSCFSVDSKDNKKIHMRMQVPHAQYSSVYNPKEVAKRINSGNVSLLQSRPQSEFVALPLLWDTRGCSAI